MPFPDGWNQDPNVGPLGPALADDRRSIINAHVKGISTANFADNAVLWVDIPGAIVRPARPLPFDPMLPSTPPAPKGLLYSRHVFVKNDGLGVIEVGFHTTDVVGQVYISDTLGPGESRFYQDRIVAGIAIRTQPLSANSAFRVTAW